MRIVLITAVVFSFACTKQNPNLCCIDEADCANVGLEEVKGCSDGLLCRGNQCIAEVCASSAECDADAPYCVAPPDGRCQMACTDDAECPGFGQSSTEVFCEAGTCIECRSSNDCGNANAPICDAGSCVACSANDQCASGVCVDDGTCADPADVAYVAPNGPSTGDCLETSPCATIEAALALGRPFVVIESGTYQRSGTVNLVGVNVRLIGRGNTRPVLRRSDVGPIVTILSAATVGLEFLELSNSTGTPADEAHGVECKQLQGVPKVRLVDAVVRNNALSGVHTNTCVLDAIRSEFRANGADGLQLIDTNTVIDACTFAENGSEGALLDGGVHVVTNSFFFRNPRNGLSLFASPGSRVEFNTIVDNGAAGTSTDSAGFFCNANGGSLSFPNNILARNKTSTDGSGCTFPSSIIVDSTGDIGPLKFVSPDVAPFDYHIQAGSMAIDAATITTLDHDFDGDPRPSSGADVGADEL